MPDPNLDYRYDVLYILNAELSQEEQDEAIEDFKGIVTAHDSGILEVAPWGLKRFAFEIDGQREGVYVNMLIHGKSCVQELDRRLRIDGRTVRHIIVKETRRQYKARLRSQATKEAIAPDTDEAQTETEAAPAEAPAEAPAPQAEEAAVEAAPEATPEATEPKGEETAEATTETATETTDTETAEESAADAPAEAETAESETTESDTPTE